MTEPDVSRRRTYYLVEIAEAYEAVSIEQGRLSRLGWTKLKEMLGHISEENADDLIAVAERSTVLQLRRHLLKKQDAESTRTMVLHLTEAQHLDLSKALERYGAKSTKRGLLGKEEAIHELALSVLTKENHTRQT